MTDFHLINFFENHDLVIYTKIVLLSCLVPRLVDILYFGDYANLCLLG